MRYWTVETHALLDCCFLCSAMVDANCFACLITESGCSAGWHHPQLWSALTTPHCRVHHTLTLGSGQLLPLCTSSSGPLPTLLLAPHPILMLLWTPIWS